MTVSRPNVRTQIRRGELKEDVLNDVLMGIYLRLEEVEHGCLPIGGNSYISSQVTNYTGGITGSIVALALTTSANVEDSFPVQLTVPCANLVGVEVVRAQNVTDPAALFYEAVDIPAWTASVLSTYVRSGIAAGTSNLVIPYITGLAPSTAYVFSIEVLDEP